MASRLDRLFLFLENCPNVTLRNAASSQLAEVVRHNPTEIKTILSRLLTLSRSKNWLSRVAAASALTYILAALPPWQPKVEEDAEVEPSGYLSLDTLDLPRIISFGARLYSVDVNELMQSEMNSKAGVKSRDNSMKFLFGDQGCAPPGLEGSCEFINPEDFDLQPADTANRYSFKKLIEDHLMKASKKSTQTTENAEPPSKRMKEELSEAASSEPPASWPLGNFYKSLVVDLWSLNWENRHGAASSLRELVSSKQHILTAGRLNDASKASIEADHRRFLEDLGVRVLVTLSLDQFSDFIMDEVVAPVRETCAQLLGVLSIHYTVDQIKLLIGHFTKLISYRGMINDDRTAWMIVHGGLLGLKYLIASRRDLWDQILPLTCPLLFSGLTSIPNWPPSPQSCQEFIKRPSGPTGAEHVYPGSEDILGAIVETLLHLSANSVFFSEAVRNYEGSEEDQKVFMEYLGLKLWKLLAESSDLSPAIGSLLRLIGALCQREESFSIIMGIDETQSSEKTLACTDTKLETFLRHIVKLFHHSSSSIRKLALKTLHKIVQLHKEYQGKKEGTNGTFYNAPISLLFLLLDQTYQRVLVETEKGVITACVELWDLLVRSSNSASLVAACIGRIDYWLCQSMQPSKLSFPPTLIDIIQSSNTRPNSSGEDHNRSNTGSGPSNDLNSITTPVLQFYLAGKESINFSERKREYFTMETRITLVGLLGELCSKMCQSDEKIITNSEDGSNSQTSVFPIVYLCRKILLDMHLSDRQAVQRFIGSIFLGCFSSFEVGDNFTWRKLMSADFSQAQPGTMMDELKTIFQDLSKRLYKNLTEVIYYDEILKAFKSMQEECFELSQLMRTSNKFNPEEINQIHQEDSKVINISQCQRLLALFDKQMSTIDTKSLENGESEMVEKLNNTYCKAKSGLDRCLEIQLFLCSRVELTTSSAMIQCNFIPSGQLTLLIRPLMDSIRGTLPIPIPNDPRTSSSQDPNDQDAHLTSVMHKASFPCTGNTERFQRMAAYSLSILLYNDWLQSLIKMKSHVISENKSKAASKVFKNLLAYYVNSDPLLMMSQNDESLIHTPTNLHGLMCQENEILEESKQPASHAQSKTQTNKKKAANPKNILPETVTDEVCPAQKNGTQEVFKFHTDSVPAIRYRGSCYALLYLCYTISKDGKFLRDLRYGLPAMFSQLWIEPANIIIKSLSENPAAPIMEPFAINPDLTETFDIPKYSQLISLLDPAFETLLIKRHPNLGSQSAEIIPVLTLNTLITPLFMRLSQESPETKEVIVEFLYKSSLFLALSQGEQGTSLQMAMATARLILVLLEHADASKIMNGLFEILIKFKDSQFDSQRLTVITIIWYIFKNLLDLPGNSSSRLLDIIRLFWTQVYDFQAKSTESSQDANLLNEILPFSVICLSMTLKLQSDSNPRVRFFSSYLFTNLLILMPLESSIPDSEGISAFWRERRIAERAFIDCLLNPTQIKPYKSYESLIEADLRPYQQDGVNWLAFLNQYNLHGILCDDLGLGKTLQSICILSGDHYEKAKTVQHKKVISIIVCPSTLKWHWFNEIKKFSRTKHNENNLRPYLYSKENGINGMVDENGLPINVVIISYDQMRHKNDFIGSVDWNYLILDEGHIIKNSKTKLSFRLRALKSQHRLILTGTPIQNHVNEVWSLFEFLMPGFLGTESHFNSRFVQPINLIRDPKASKSDHNRGQLALERLHKIILPFMLRRMKEDVLKDLPPKIIQDYICELTPMQQRLYEHSKSASSSEDDTKKAIGFEKMQYLQAVCNHPSLVLGQEKGQRHPLYNWALSQVKNPAGLNDIWLSGKLIALTQLLGECGFREGMGSDNSETDHLGHENRQELISAHRLLIFTKTKKMLALVENLLEKNFPSLSFLKMSSELNSKDRFAMVQRFNSDVTIDVLILTTSIGGLGLNLTGADTVIFVENDWNPTKDQQAMDRAHRIGQKRTVNVYRLITKNTIEEEILSLQNFKSHLANSIINAENATFSGTQSQIGSKDGSILDNMTNKDFSFDQIRKSLTRDPDAVEEEAQYDDEYTFDNFLNKLVTREPQ